MGNEDFYKSGKDVSKVTNEYNLSKQKVEELTRDWEQLQLQTVE